MSKIPQEAIEAAEKSLSHEAVWVGRKTLIRALEAADAVRAQGAEIAVKPLEWEVFCGNFGNSKAKAFFDQYVVQSEKVDDLPDWRIYLPNNDHNTGIKYTTIEAAKAAAQADYEQRIRSALTTPPVQAQGTSIVAVPDNVENCRNQWGDIITIEEAARALYAAFRASPNSFQHIGYRSDLWTVLAECLRNLDGPVFDAARAALAGEAPSQTDRAEGGE